MRPWLQNIMRPMSEKYANLAGYRKLGLVYVPPPPLTTAHPPVLFLDLLMRWVAALMI